jgi:hypothetical protein
MIRFIKKNIKTFDLLVLILLIPSFISTLALAPDIFYPKANGIVSNVSETTIIDYFSLTNRSLKRKKMEFPAYLFIVDGKKYYLLKGDNKFNYYNLLGKCITFKYSKEYEENIGMNIYTIECDGNIIYSVNKYIYRFFKWLSITFLCCAWFIGRLVVIWKIPNSKSEKQNTNKEEYFFYNWCVLKNKDYYVLSYISRLDGSIRKIRISEEEFVSAKNGKMTLEDFYSTYTLW